MCYKYTSFCFLVISDILLFHSVVLHLSSLLLAFILFLFALISVLTPKQLEHLTKRRASVPSSKRPPAKYKAILDNVKQSEQTTNLTDQCEQNRTLMTCQSSCEMTSSIVFPSSMESSYISLPGLPNVEVDDEIMV